MKHNRFYALAFIVLYPFIRLLYRPKAYGLEHIPEGKAVFCCNHSSNIDPMLIMVTAGFGHQLYAMAKIEISRWPFVGWFLKKAGMIFVDRGKADIGAVKAAMKCLKQDQQILIFPEGTRVSEEESSAAKGGAAMLSVRMSAPIVPIYLESRKKIFRRNKIVYGEPFQPTVAGRRGTSEEYQQISDEILRRIYELKKV